MLEILSPRLETKAEIFRKEGERKKAVTAQPDVIAPFFHKDFHSVPVGGNP